MKKIIFNTGLPRSGSTILSEILNQNPRFESHITSPVKPIIDSIIEAYNYSTSNMTYIDNNKMDDMLRSIIETYHNTTGKSVYFNGNRGWLEKMDVLKRIYPDYKMIITVRDIGWILDSFELIVRKSPYNISTITKHQNTFNIYNRCDLYMNNFILPCYNSIRELIYSNSSQFMIIEYDALVSKPEMVMEEIYRYIEEPYFNHNFDEVVGNDHTKFDNDINLPGLHNIRKKVSYIERKSIIPKDIWDRYNGMEIWKNLKS